MSERERPRGGVFQRPFDAIASVVVPVVADAVDPDDLVDRIDVNALVERIDVDALLGRVDVNTLVGRLDLDTVLDRIDVDALLDRIDLDKLFARIDLDAIVDRIDIDRVVSRVDLDAIVDRVDVDRVVARVDLDAAADRIDVERVVSRVDLDAIVDRVDVDRVVARVDVDAIAASLDIDTIVARSTKGVFGRFMDLLRRQVVGVDEISMRAVSRLLRRDYDALPAGPPLALGAEPRDEVDTMSGRYAGPVSRLGALGLDVFLISSTFTLLLAGISYLIDVLFGASIDLGDSGNWLAAVALLFYGFFYFWFSQALTGRTISQALVGLKVIRSDGEPLSPGAAAIRTIVLPFSFLFFGIGALMALVDRRRRALQDVAAGSSVVYDWGDRPAALPAPITRFLDRREATRPQASDNS
jgi:uncharacterized RDD family membrane protein YckC